MSDPRPDAPPRWAPPLLAVQLLTRVPVPGTARLTPGQARVALGRSLVWFPVVGGLVGLVTALVVLTAGQWWPAYVAALLALVVEARLTGAFHEDAVADLGDALGGGTTRERTLEILKDSRVGSYGALALVLAVGLRAALLTALALTAPPALLVAGVVSSAALGRLAAVTVMRVVPPVARPAGLSQDVGGRASGRSLGLATLMTAPLVVPLALLDPVGLGLALAGAALVVVWLRRLLLRRLGGQTGDCLGAAVYAVQLVVLLAVTAG